MEKLNDKKVPQELKDRKQWVCWKHIDRDGKLTKTPFQPNGEPAKSNDPDTWSTYDQAVYAIDWFEGIGFMFSESDPYCGIDLDGCRDAKTGKFEWWAHQLLKEFDSYSEVSPSGTGAKIFVRAINPRTSGKKIGIDAAKVCDKEPGLEIYDRLRYFAITGCRLGGISASTEDRQEQVTKLCDKHWPSATPFVMPKIDNTNVNVMDRARRYLVRMPPSISGSDGHGVAFRTACILVLGFGLTREEAMLLLSEWNQSCRPPWSEKELLHKVEEANKQPGERNFLRDTPQQQWQSIVIPKFTAPVEPKHDGITLASAAESYLSQLESGEADLIELGVSDLDYAIGGGVAPGEMIIIASRPSHGKSAVALQCLDITSQQGLVGVMISEEMSHYAIGKRVIQYACDEPQERWQYQLPGVRKDLKSHFKDRALVHIVQDCRSVDRAAASLKFYAKEHGAKVAVVDYAQILSSKGNNRVEQVSATSIALRQVANDTGMVVIVLCQLNRAVESREMFVPRASDLRDSGQLEQDADVVVFLVWPHRIDSKNDPEIYRMFVAKNRNRPINANVVESRFVPSRQMVLPPSSGGGNVATNEEIEAFNQTGLF